MDLGLGAGLAGYDRRPAFNLDVFMSRQPSGLFVDFTKTDRLFVETYGPTPASAIGNAIGLALDQREWAGRTPAQVRTDASPELLVPGSWTTGTAGGSSTSAESPAGTLTLTGDGTNFAFAQQAIATVVGATYAVFATAAGNAATGIAGTTSGGSEQASFAVPVGAPTAYFRATATTTYLRFRRSGAGAVVLTALSCKRIALGATLIQNNGSFRPVRDAGGAAYDGTDDHHLSNYLAGAGANFIFVLADVPASIATANRVVAGASDAGPANRFQLGANTGTGFASAGIGTQSTSTIVGTTDLRGTTSVFGVACDGSQVRLFVNENIEYEQAQSGVPTTTTPLTIGAAAANSARWPGTIRKLLVGREYPSLALYRQIRASLLG